MEVIVSNNKKYEWVPAVVIDSETILVSYINAVEEVKKLVVNNREYNVSKINNNQIKASDIESEDLLLLNECDKIYAKVKMSKELSQAYPVFSIDYKENLLEIDLPFEVKNNRFDQIIITNNGSEVIINPNVILFPERLYAFYDVNRPTKLKFNRYILPEDSIAMQYVNHRICKYNKDTFFDMRSTEHDIDKQMIIDSILSFEDELISLPHIYDALENVGNQDTDPSKNLVDVSIGSAPSIPVDRPSINDETANMIDDFTLNANPDISLIATLNKPIPTNSNRPVAARPSRLYTKATIQQKSRYSDEYSKYNFEWTKKFMQYRNQAKDYLNKANSKLSPVIDNLQKLRDSLQAMINYICNVMCIEEILRGIVEVFKKLMAMLDALLNMSLQEMINKINNLFKRIADSIAKAVNEMKEALKRFVSGVVRKIENIFNAVVEGTKKALEAADALVNKVISKVTDILNSISALFNLFDWSLIGLYIGKAVKQILDTIGQALQTIANAISRMMDKFLSLFSQISGKTDDIRKKLADINLKSSKYNFKNLTMNLNLHDIVDYICNRLLGGILETLDGIIDLLKYLQKRFQQFIDRFFADNYKSKFSDLDKLEACGDFLRSHINICDILRNMLATNDFTVAGFIRRVTRLEEIFETWKRNKKILQQAARLEGNEDREITDLATAGNVLTNSILSLDEIFGTNEAMITRIIQNLKKAFIPNFQSQTESVLDTQNLSKQIFDPEKFKHLANKITYY